MGSTGSGCGGSSTLGSCGSIVGATGGRVAQPSSRAILNNAFFVLSPYSNEGVTDGLFCRIETMSEAACFR
jgi:hypothetical protein